MTPAQWESQSHDILGKNLNSHQAQLVEEFTSVELDNLVDGDCDEDWLLVDADEREQLANERIEELAWAFKPEFLAYFTSLPPTMFVTLAEECEDSNDAVLTLIKRCGRWETEEKNWEAFVTEALKADSHGHFLSPYDGQEYEIEDAQGNVKFWLYRLT